MVDPNRHPDAASREDDPLSPLRAALAAAEAGLLDDADASERRARALSAVLKAAEGLDAHAARRRALLNEDQRLHDDRAAEALLADIEALLRAAAGGDRLAGAPAQPAPASRETHP